MIELARQVCDLVWPYVEVISFVRQICCVFREVLSFRRSGIHSSSTFLLDRFVFSSAEFPGRYAARLVMPSQLALVTGHRRPAKGDERRPKDALIVMQSP